MSRPVRVIFALFFLPALFQIPLSAQSFIKAASATASSGEKAFSASMACDGDMKTRWGSDFSDYQWIKFEFIKPSSLRAVGIHWETAAAYSYKILVSTDDENWQAAAEITGEWERNYRKINFDRTYQAKYVMIKCSERLTQWGYSIYEAEFSRDPYKDTYSQPPFAEGRKFFKAAKVGNNYWLVNPDGNLFISKGVNAVSAEDGAVKPGGQGYSVAANFKGMQDWGASAVQRLKGLNFNTLGSWSDSRSFAYDLPFAVFLYVNVSDQHRLADVFDPGFETRAEETLKKNCRYMRNAEYLVGYFIDNELPWYGDVGWYTGHVTTLADVYAGLPSGSPGRKALDDFLRSRNRSINDINDDDREDFAGIVADRYYSVMTAAIRRNDPNHLILGSRFANNAPKRVIEACGKYCDVISINYYAKDKKLKKAVFDNLYFLGRKPVMVTEFSYRAMENASGDKNTTGADVTVKTQEDRADGFRKYVEQLMDFPYVVGYHWFEYIDESPQGRSFDGEDSNYGIYDIHDNIYSILASTMAEVNLKVEKLHERASLPYPDSYSEITEGYAKVNNTSYRQGKPGRFFSPMTYSSAYLSSWGDKGSSVNYSTGTDAAGIIELSVKYDTGNGWGCGMSIHPASAAANKDGSADLQGYTQLEFDMSLPKGANFYVFLNESGAGPAEQQEYKSVRGADGESFTSPALKGNGERKKYMLDLGKFKVRLEFGNQNGNKMIDLQAIKNIDLYIPSRGGAGHAEIYGITFR